MAIWLTLAAVLLALWSATIFVDSGNFLIAGLAALAPLVTVFALPVIAIAVGSRHAVPLLIALVAAALPWTLVTGYAAAGPGRASIGSNSTLRVMSVNGAHGRADPKQIVQLTRSYEVDVVVVTELTGELAHELTVAGLNSLTPSRWVQVPAGGEGTGVYSRLEITDLRPIAGLSRPSVQGSLDAGRGGVSIVVAQLAGEPLRTNPSWRSDLRVLAQDRSQGRRLLVGDLNATPWNPGFRTLIAAGWRDAADVVGQGLRPTWPAWSPLPVAPLDHVLVGGLRVSGADTTEIRGSDHRALIVTLVVPHAGG